MCRWLAYSGSPVSLHTLLYKPQHSLIDQSLHSKLGVETTNGDGFGVGWYGEADAPGVFHSAEPAWNDRNLRGISEHIVSPLVFAHIRASTGSPVQQTNCHPFRYGRWLWMHNGGIANFQEVKRDLVARGRPVALPVDRGLDRLGGVLLPRAHARARGRSAGGRCVGGGADRRGRPQARRRTPDPDDDRDDRRHERPGRSGTRAKETRARSSSRRTYRPSGSCIPTSTSSRTWTTSRG